MNGVEGKGHTMDVGWETWVPSVIKGIIVASVGLELPCVRSVHLTVDVTLFLPGAAYARAMDAHAPCLLCRNFSLPRCLKFLMFLFKCSSFPLISMVTDSPNTFCKIPASNCQEMPLSGFVYMTLRLRLLRTLPWVPCMHRSPLLVFSATLWLWKEPYFPAFARQKHFNIGISAGMWKSCGFLYDIIKSPV